MTFRKKIGIQLMGLAASLLAIQVQALALSDVGIRNPAGKFENASAAQQGKGNANLADINALTGLFAGDAWSFLDETNKSCMIFKEESFVLTADLKHTSGVWTLSPQDSGLPLYMDFAVVMKGEGQWGAYLFESKNISSGGQSVGGNFQMPFINKHGKIAKLDHASIYGRLAKTEENLDSNSIPVPGSLALFAMGLLLCLVQMRKNVLAQAKRIVSGMCDNKQK